MYSNSLKKQSLLSWLVDFTWTTPAIAGEVMGLSSRSSINKSLRQFEQLGLIKSDALEKATFEISRVAQSTTNHRLDVQRCRLKLKDIKGLEWISENNYPKELSYRPDAIIKTSKFVVALELERTAKTRKRYQLIIVQHLRQINLGAYEKMNDNYNTSIYRHEDELITLSINKPSSNGGAFLAFDANVQFGFTENQFSDSLIPILESIINETTEGKFKFYQCQNGEYRFQSYALMLLMDITTAQAMKEQAKEGLKSFIPYSNME